MAGLRRARWPVGLAAVLVALVGIALAALPEIVRSVAVREIAALTRRELALDDVDLNLFTGRVALKGFRLAQRDSSDTALGFERLDAGVSLASLLFKHARVTELRLTAPRIAATRTGPTTFDFSDLLALIPRPILTRRRSRGS